VIPFRECWACDFEFRADPGERPWPVCMVARELHTGQEIRLWRGELLSLRTAPFNIGSDAVFVAYFASAELGCFLELGWPMPANVLDLYAEHRCETNGVSTTLGDGLLGALALRGLAHMDLGEKETMRRLVLDNNAWSDADQAAILDYCASDVAALIALLPRMAPTIDWPRAILRGRYMAAVARMEWAGVPIDTTTHRRMVGSWDSIKRQLVAEIDPAFGVFNGLTFKADRFGAYLRDAGIDWPRFPIGQMKLDDTTFRDQTLQWPQLLPLHELRVTLANLRLTGLEVGSDSRNRCLLSPFRAVTGRNQPSNTRFIFGPARWMRGLIQPPKDWGIAYVDFSSQEIAIAAAFSGDERMMAGYSEGDPYLAFARAARLAPADATKATHGAVRERCKTIVLGIGYGMAAESMAARAGITPCEARELLRLHQDTYRAFWRWSDSTVDAALLTGAMTSVFGWRRRVGREPNPRSLMNWPMQAAGAEMMRIAAIAATEAGLEVCAPVHDAFLIAAPLDRLDADVAEMRALMSRAGRAVTGGLDVRTDAEVIRWPDRFMDPRGAAMWQRVVGMLPAVDERLAA
jgi:DNA polymerase I